MTSGMGEVRMLLKEVSEVCSMTLQVKKYMLAAKDLLISSSVCKSLFMAVCPNSITSAVQRQSLSWYRMSGFSYEKYLL
jgi:hypothetical protein